MIDERFVQIPAAPEDVGIDCEICGAEITAPYFLRIRDAAFICESCRENDSEGEP